MAHLITFGDSLFENQKRRIREEAEGTGWFDSVTAHSPETISGFLDLHREFVSRSRGYGCWIWKPHIMLERLETMGEGEILFYMDSGGSVLPHRAARFSEYLRMLRGSDRPVLAFSDMGEFGGPPRYREAVLQKMRVLKRFGLEGDRAFLESGQAEAGVIGCMKSDFTVRFLREWLDLLTENGYWLVDDEDDSEQLPEFASHRHDQSIFSILCKRRGAHLLGIEECYGMGPFFSSRVTDDGPRPLAPDWFRREHDYDNMRHFSLADYLADPVVREDAANRLRRLIRDSAGGSGGMKGPFLSRFVPSLDRLQFDKGIPAVSVSFDDPAPYESREVVGEVVLEFAPGDEIRLPFTLGASGVVFVSGGSGRACRSQYSRRLH